MNVERWFSTPVLWHDVPQETSKKISDDFFSKEDDIKRALQNGTWGDNITSSFASTVDFISRFELYELSEVVAQAAHELTKVANVHRKLIRKESWVNYQNKYQYQNMHAHSMYDISVCYYIKATVNDGLFKVHPPVEELSMWNQVSDGGTIDYKPRTGLVLAFPSSMKHSVNQNMTDNTRISIACNYRFEDQK
jgi:uncharacterized protein (TIGR02466 family)